MKEIAFQQKYIAKITDAAVELLNDQYQVNSRIIFQAPTGSGKTYMISQALSEIVKQCKEPLAFLWISVNSLHEQSLENLNRYLEDERLLECITVDEILDNAIDENQIVFLNWESLIKKNNVFRLDNERDWTLKNVSETTKEEGRRIILIIDESHRTANAESAQDVIAEIGPTLTVEMTATPVHSPTYRIPLPEVIDAGLIKREILINPEGKTARENRDLLELALKKRKNLKKQYESLGKNVNPLLLVQIPNKKIADATNPEDYIVGLLADFDITVSNERLAIWLSEKKENKDLVELDDSPVDVLIFKEAIATGWDCPRASILFLQREWKTERYSFNIQTLGRIMRMPEQQHYENNPDLNAGYVYSASDNFEIVEELAADYASSVQMHRDSELYEQPLKLVSEFVRRKREQTRLSGDFKKCLFEAAKELDLENHINDGVPEIQRKIGTDGKIGEIDKAQSVEFGDSKRIRIPREQIANEYSNFTVKESLPYSAARSSQIIKSSIRSWFKEKRNIDNEDQVAKNVIQGNNRSKFKELLDRAKEIYGNLPTKSDETIVNDQWEIPASVGIYANYKAINSSKSILKDEEQQNYCVKLKNNGHIDLSGPETQFIESLEKSDDETQWWFKNGVSESKYFGIAYKKPDGHLYGFYPDFIIKTKKEVLIVEIKDDKAFTTENFLKLRAGKEYLSKYDQKEKIRFYILSPDDFDGFFRHVKDQELDSFKSIFEEQLLRWARSSQVVIKNKVERTGDDAELLKYYEQEFAKVAAELKDTKAENELLGIDLQQAQENLKALGTVVEKEQRDTSEPIEIQRPFRICVLGDVSDTAAILKELQAYFSKHGVKTNDWSADFVNNSKLKNSNTLKSLVKGKSKFNLIITGQIYHHAGRGNSKSNIFSELKNEKYVPHVVGSDPTSELTPDRALKALESFLRTSR